MMKIVMAVMCCMLSCVAVAKDDVEDHPEKLTSSEVIRVRGDMEKNKSRLQNHWRSRLNLAKKNDDKLAKPGMPLQRPYYGDYKLNSEHQH